MPAGSGLGGERADRSTVRTSAATCTPGEGAGCGGFGVGAGGCGVGADVTPVPLSATVTGLAGRFSSIHRRPVRLPVEPGAKLIRIWQLWPGAREAGQSLVWVKSPVVRIDEST